MLAALGFDTEEERVYRALIHRTRATPPMLAGEVAIADDQVEATLTRLVERGLATRCGSWFVPVPPTLALGALINRRKEVLYAAEQAVAGLLDEYAAVERGDGG